MAEEKKLRKIQIVVEERETADGKIQLHFYLDGDKERIADGKVSEKELSPGEFWTKKLFSICLNSLRVSGAIQKPVSLGNAEKPSKLG